MKIKTSELSGPVLAYAAAIAEGWTCYWTDSAEQGDWLHPSGTPHGPRVHRAGYRPDLDWSQGGPISEREKITAAFTGKHWEAHYSRAVETPSGVRSYCLQRTYPTNCWRT